MHPARGLRAYDAAALLSEEVRAAIARFPSGARYDLVDQLSRAVRSIGANIAEGSVQGTVPERLRFFRIALRSASETLHHLNDCNNAGLLQQKKHLQLADRASVTHAILSALIRSLGG
jgi:four helix bundle protein